MSFENLKLNMKKAVFLSAMVVFAVQCAKNEPKPSGKISTEVAKIEIPTDTLKNYAEKTKVLLVSNLTQKIKDSGTVGALEFCNIEA